MANVAAANNNAAPAVTMPRGRVTYVLPPCSEPPQWYNLPPPGAPRKGRSGPLLLDGGARGASRARLNSTQASGAEASTSAHPRHTLPVTSLALDTTTCISDGKGDDSKPRGILYTGARDGLACAWELGLETRRRTRGASSSAWRRADRGGDASGHSSFLGAGHGNDEEDDWGSGAPRLDDDDDEEEIPFEHQWEIQASQDGRLPKPSFRQCIQSHTDWINDMLLCNMNQTIITASNDRTVKVWNTHTQPINPQVLGTHSDYVKALSHAKDAGWIASGGFDRVIKVWDINEMRKDPIFTLPQSAVRSSVYALATNPNGNVIAAGSPEKVIRIFDPRSGQQIAQLVGHTDNIRSVLISDDARHLLSASSDTTVRLWSLGEQRCLHTFTHHSDSVWSLASADPNLDIFYSGDRRGYVCKVDFQRCSEVAEGECVLVCQDTGDSEEPGAGAGESTAKGIQRIVAQDNSFIWTASGGSGVSCWKDVPSRSTREALYPIGASASSTTRFAHLPSTSMFSINTTDTETARLIDPPISQSPTSPPSALRTGAGQAQSKPASSGAAVTFAEREATTPPRASTGPAIRHRHNHSVSSIGASSSVATPTRSKASATLWGLPFTSLISLAPVSDPYGAAVGLSSVSLRGSFAAPGLAHRMGAPSTASLHVGDPTRASIDAMSHSSPGALASPHLAHMQTGAQRPASIRFAPLQFSDSGADAEDETTSDDGQVLLMPAGAIDDDDDEDDDAEDLAIEARQAYEDRELAEEATPLRTSPECCIEGSHGLIRSSMLNDRRHVLTVGTDGRVSVWDILFGRCLGAFVEADVVQAAKEAGIERKQHRPTPKASSTGSELTGDEGAASDADEAARRLHHEQHRFQRALPPGEVLDLVRGRIEGEGATPLWCNIDTSIGLLSVHLDDPRCFDAEVYLDGCGDEIDLSEAREEQRVNVGKWILRSLFDGFVNTEMRLRGGPSPVLPPGAFAKDKPNALSQKPLRIAMPRQDTADAERMEEVTTPGMTVMLAMSPMSPARLPGGATPLTPAALRTPRGAVRDDYFGASADGNEQQQAFPSPSSLRREPTKSSVVSSGSATPVTVPSNGGGGGSGLMSKLKFGLGGKGSKEKNGNGAAEVKAEMDPVVRAEEAQRAVRQGALKTIQPFNEAPAIKYSPKTSIILTSSDEVVYRGLVRSTEADVAVLEEAAPMWLLDQLLGNKAVPHVVKISFTLTPWSPNASDPNAAQPDGFGGFSSVGSLPLPELPTGNARLTASRMLRVNKACMYVADKLGLAHARSRHGSIALTSRPGSRRPSADLTAAGGTTNGLAMSSLAMSRVEEAPGSSAASVAASEHNPSSTNGAAASLASGAATPASTGVGETAEDLIEILCGDTVLPPNLTLAQVQRFYAKTGSGDIKLGYRRRQPGTTSGAAL